MEIGKKKSIILNNIKIDTTLISGTPNIGIGTTILENSYSSNFSIKIHVENVSIKKYEY